MLFFTSIQNNVYEYITPPFFHEPWAMDLNQYRDSFCSNADQVHTRRITKGRDVTKSDACARKMQRTHAVCIWLYSCKGGPEQSCQIGSFRAKNQKFGSFEKQLAPKFLFGYLATFWLFCNISFHKFFFEKSCEWCV